MNILTAIECSVKHKWNLISFLNGDETRVRMRKRTARDSDDASDGGGQPSSALVRGLELLRAFKTGDATLGNQEIIARTGLPKATVSRLTFTLSELGYLTYNSVLGRYSLGPASVALGYSALTSNAVVHIARPLMQDLADRTGAAIALGTRDTLEMVYLSNCRSESLVTLRLNPGSHVPLWNSGMGLAYMAGIEDHERDDVIARLCAAEPESASQIVASVAAAREEYLGRGYITSFGRWQSYIRAIGVPFVPSDGSPTVAITCGGIAELVTDERAHSEMGPALVSLVAALKARLEGDVTASLVWPSSSD
jgi:DNA-binding IclR family transcriptional regulator